MHAQMNGSFERQKVSPLHPKPTSACCQLHSHFKVHNQVWLGQAHIWRLQAALPLLSP